MQQRHRVPPEELTVTIQFFLVLRLDTVAALVDMIHRAMQAELQMAMVAVVVQVLGLVVGLVLAEGLEVVVRQMSMVVVVAVVQRRQVAQAQLQSEVWEGLARL